ncbi:MAG: N-acetylneuraminate synthase family protein, partial [Cyclobacteriaceae bacterium]|nr:N-acetylneuraminate synthase family protein [Cyclobacteriaceae bacterium]
MFKDLFVLEMANNHQGSVDHGLRIIKEAGDLVKKYNLNAGVKLQYRDIDTFIHPKYKKAQDVKHIPRFMSTRLTDAQFKKMVEATAAAGMRTIVTPFDEASVAKCLDHKVDILKVASCSADDWPLLEEIAAAGKPVIFSTGGLTIPQVDNLVTFFTHKHVPFAMMHCVSIYPTENPQAQLRFLSKMKKRYPGVTIGYSGHEAPGNTDIAKVAVGIGAQMLERHIGVPDQKKGIKLNAYSMDPKELDHWFQEVALAKSIVGEEEEKQIVEVEQDSLLSLKRGVFAKKPI